MQVETFGQIVANHSLSGEVNAEAEELRALLLKVERRLAGALIVTRSGEANPGELDQLRTERTRLTEQVNDLALVLRELRRQRRALKRQDGAQRVHKALSTPCGASPCPNASAKPFACSWRSGD